MFEFYIQFDHSNECINYLNYNTNLSPHIINKENAETEIISNDNNNKNDYIKNYSLDEFNDILKKYIIDYKNKSKPSIGNIIVKSK